MDGAFSHETENVFVLGLNWKIVIKKGFSLYSNLFLLHAIHSPFFRSILKKNILFSGFKNHYKKSSSLFMTSILKNWKMRVENQTKLESEKIRVYAQKPWLKLRFTQLIFQKKKKPNLR